MSATPFMQMYWSDYFGDTRHLTCEQHGAYLQLLGSMWLAGGSLQNDARKLAKITGCTASRWAKISPDVLAFFTVEGEVLTHKRVEFELQKAREKSIKRAEAGSLGGAAKALKAQASRVANATSLPKHPPDSESDSKPESQAEESPPNPPNGGAADPIFEQAWNAYPEAGRATLGRIRAFDAWKGAVLSAGSNLRLLAAVQAYGASDYVAAGGKPRRFDRWLSDRAFEIFLAKPECDAVQRQPWPGPPEVWAIAVQGRDEPWAWSYVGKCSFSDGVLVAPSEWIAQRIRQEVGPDLNAHGVRIRHGVAA